MSQSTKQPTEEIIAWHDEQSRGVQLSEAEILQQSREEILKAAAENDGASPALNRLIDAVSLLHDLMHRRLMAEQAEEHATEPAAILPLG